MSAPCPVDETFGSWTVLGQATPDPNTRTPRWHVRCACGATCVRRACQVRRGGACIRCKGAAGLARRRSNGGTATKKKRASRCSGVQGGSMVMEGATPEPCKEPASLPPEGGEMEARSTHGSGINGSRSALIMQEGFSRSAEASGGGR